MGYERPMEPTLGGRIPRLARPGGRGRPEPTCVKALRIYTALVATPPEQDAALDALDSELSSLPVEEQAERRELLLQVAVAVPRKARQKIDERTLDARIDSVVALAKAAKSLK